MSKGTHYSEACYKVVGFQQMSEELICKLAIVTRKTLHVAALLRLSDEERPKKAFERMISNLRHYDVCGGGND